MSSQFKRDNHYISCFYLERWALSNGRLWAYRTLVSHKNVDLWKPASVKGVGWHAHLYTRLIKGAESDEVELWLDREFESPAAEPFRKAVEDEQLSKEDWLLLSRFLAAQDVRTPARLREGLVRWHNEIPGLVEQVTRDAVSQLEAGLKGKSAPLEAIRATPSYADLLPLRVSNEADEFGNPGLRTQVVVGRGMWLFSMRHLLTKNLDVLSRHRWTILRPAKGLSWMTTDDPVVKLNYRSAANYDFGGGWGSQGTEIFMPLSPSHLLYTKVGHRPPRRGLVLGAVETQFLQRAICEHAHRLVFSESRDPHVVSLRPRVVDARAYALEADEWKRWHEKQVKAESFEEDPVASSCIVRKPA
jgi:hypothetical protein